MKGIVIALALLAVMSARTARAGECDTSSDYATEQVPLGGVTKLKVYGASATITYKSVDYAEEPMIMVTKASTGFDTEFTDTKITMMAGECAEDYHDGHDHDEDDHDDSDAAVSMLSGLAFPAVITLSSMLSPRFAVVATLALLVGSHTVAADCDDALEIEVAMPPPEAMIMMEHKSGQYEECPPETMYVVHHPSVFEGYEGCAGENGLSPCPQDGFGGMDAIDDYNKPYDFVGGECVETGETHESQYFWILWGHPMDKYELTVRTGMNPVISFPFTRGPYPSYWGSHGNDAESALAYSKDWLVYLGAFTMSQLDEFTVDLNEGAESGMVALFGAKALEIARTTCNRAIYVLVEAPCYGYSTSDAAGLANKAGGFLTEDENGVACPTDDVTVSVMGWLPGTDLPTAMGADGNEYAADDASYLSPWFESMVFPENPSGVVKTPQLPNVNRRVCDGVYLYPMYFATAEIPADLVPDCSAWSFSITKMYSASVRAGTAIYKTSPSTNHDAMSDVFSSLRSMTNGLYSEWSWSGQEQLFKMFMEKPIDDPTSWIGAYSALMTEKWDFVTAGFEECDTVTITNPYMGAYVWFKFEDPYLGGMNSEYNWFTHSINIQTTTYYWGFRGSDPADYYGAGYTTKDFTRMQLYRDISVYEEVGRRAAIVCGGGSLPNMLSTDEWFVAATAAMVSPPPSGRKLLDMDGVEQKDMVHRAFQHVEGRLGAKVTQMHETRAIKSLETAAAVELNCAAEGYTTDCLFKHMGIHGPDN